MNSRVDVDVGIVGGGPAGLAAGIAARQNGFRVAVIEAARPPIDKACGEGLMPDGVAALSRMGVVLGHEGASFAGLRFVDGASAVDARFGCASGAGVRRTVLHRLLAARAAECGVDLHWGTAVRSVSDGIIRTDRHEFRCRWLIGADGRNSIVGRRAGLDGGRCSHRRFGFRRHFRVESWPDLTEVHWSDAGQAYVTPVGRGEICVAAVSRLPGFRFEDLYSAFPGLAARLRQAEPLTAVRGAVSVSRSLRSVSRGRVALIGDASGSVDAITGEGLCLAFQQAAALGDALAQNDLAAYVREHRRIFRLPALMGRLLLLLDRHPELRRRVFAAFAAEPSLFRRLLSIHTGELPPGALGWKGVLALGRRVVIA